MYVPFIARNLTNRYSVDHQAVKPASRDHEVQTDRNPIYRRKCKIYTMSASSQLSNVGSSSLKNLNRFISDKEVYEKQQKNYNIISVQPKEYQDTIKMFPKYRL